MGSPINKVLFNCDQTADTTEAQKAQARANIGVEALPDKTGNANKVLAVNSTATGLEWVAGGGAQAQANWTETNPNSVQYILNKPDLSTYATQTQLASKQDVLTAGTGITIDNEGVISVDESAVQEIFPVTYGSTTFQEIRTALVAGKLPVMFRNDGADFALQVQRIPLHTFFNVGGSPGSSYAQFWSPYVYTSSSPSFPPYALFAVYSASYDFKTHNTTWSTSYKYISEQSDWAESDATKLTFIKNKPAIPAALSAGSGINITNDIISRRVQFVTTSSTYAYVRNIIDNGDLPVLDRANGSMHDLYVCTMYRGSDIQFIGSAYGQTTLYNLASDNTWTSQILEPQILAGNAGKILAVNAAGTDAEWRSWVAVPSYAFADRNKVLKVVYDGTSTTLAWGQPSGYTQWETDWASGYSHNHTVTADDVSAGYFEMYQAFATSADTTSTIVDPIRVNLTWDTQCSSGLASNYVSSIDFAIGVDGGSYRDMFTDNAPAHEVHKDWFLYPNYLLHTRCNRIRIRYHLTANATAGTEFQNEVSGLVDQVR